MGTPHFVPDGEGAVWESIDLDYSEHFDPSGTANEADYGYADDFVLALDEGREHTSSGSEGLHVIEVMMGIFESAAYGRSVDLPQTKRDHPLLRWRREAGLHDPEPMPRDYNAWLAAEDARLGRI